MPLPVPFEPPVIVIHESLLTACQPQPAGAVTFTIPDPPSAKKDWLVGEIMRGGFEAVKSTPAELLPATGSRITEVTDARFVTVWPSGTLQFTEATIVVTAEEPAANTANVTTRLFAVPAQTPPPDEQETKVRAAGRLSVNVTETASSGPLLVSVIV